MNFYCTTYYYCFVQLEARNPKEVPIINFGIFTSKKKFSFSDGQTDGLTFGRINGWRLETAPIIIFAADHNLFFFLCGTDGWIDPNPLTPFHWIHLYRTNKVCDCK